MFYKSRMASKFSLLPTAAVCITPLKRTFRPRWHSTMVLQSSIDYGLQFPVLMLLDLRHHCVI